MPHIERAREELEALDGLWIEGTGQSDHCQVLRRDNEAVRVVNLDAVHHRQVLIGAAATNRDAAAKLVGADDARERLQSSKDILESARERSNLQ